MIQKLDLLQAVASESILKPIMLENWARERFWTNGQSRDPRTTTLWYREFEAIKSDTEGRNG
jgi:hypothetical protein